MADHSNIEWTNATWNPITGCSIISPGCTHCYAMKLAGTRLRNHPSRRGLTEDTKTGPVWNGRLRFNDFWLDQPIKWSKARKIFVCAHGDLFHEDASPEWIEKIFAVMAICARHTFQVLTKRAVHMRAHVERIGKNIETIERHARTLGYTLKFEGKGMVQWPLPNVMLGVSAERQTEADLRIPILLETPAAFRFVSLEPLLGPMNIARWLHDSDCRLIDGTERECSCCEPREVSLDWIIVGGESGKFARPMLPEWARSLRDQCAAAGKAERFFFKQWGEHMPCEFVRVGKDGEIWRRDANGAEFWFFGEKASDGAAVRMSPVGKKKSGRLLDGIEHNGFPT